jgi:3-oxoacyl-[acyl-carrier protein] reductase
MTNYALVTGAAGGIGRAIVQRLASDGFPVIATDTNEAGAAEVVASLPGSGHKAFALDVTDEAKVQSLFNDVETNGAKIGLVVAAAGILLLRNGGQRPPLTEISLDEWELTQRVNSTGTFLLLREYLRARTRAPVESGRFVAFSSVAAQLGGYRSSSAYIASKSAVLGLVKAAAREAASMGITINAVAPGLIDAPMLHQSLDPENYASVTGNIPLLLHDWRRFSSARLCGSGGRLHCRRGHLRESLPARSEDYARRRGYHFSNLLQCAGVVLLGSCGPCLESQRDSGRHLAHHDLAGQVPATVRILPCCCRAGDACSPGSAWARDRP